MATPLGRAPAVGPLLILTAAAILAWPTGVDGAQEALLLGGPGPTLYRERCASCHDDGPTQQASRAPLRASLAALSREAIVAALSPGGVMAPMATGMTAIEHGGRRRIPVEDRGRGRRSGRRPVHDAGPAAGRGGRAAAVERLGQRPHQLALPAGGGSRAHRPVGSAPDLEMGVRHSRRHRGERPADGLRRPGDRRQRVGLRLRPRRGHGLRALAVQGRRRRAQRGRRRTARRHWPGPLRRLLRRPARHRLRRGSRTAARSCGRSRSTTTLLRASPAERRCSRAGSTCRCRRSRSCRARAPTTRAAPSAAASWRSTPPPASRSGRPSRFPRRRRSSARTPPARRCGNRPAPPSGRRRRSTPRAGGSTSPPATPIPSRRRRRPTRSWPWPSTPGPCSGCRR